VLVCVCARPRQREAAEAETTAADAAAGAPRRANAVQQLPPALRRRYRVYFKPAAKADVQRLREVRAGEIGKMVTVKACTRTHVLSCTHTFSFPLSRF
jgi:hypothetical protein